MTGATDPHVPALTAMAAAANAEWQTHGPAHWSDWSSVNFRQWPRGFHRSAWVVAGYIGWNPLDVLDQPPPAARAVNAILTQLCVTFIIVMIRHTPDPLDPGEPLLAWFNATMNDHKHDIATTIEALGAIDWHLPASNRQAARKLVRTWNRQGLPGFRDLSGALVNKPKNA